MAARHHRTELLNLLWISAFLGTLLFIQTCDASSHTDGLLTRGTARKEYLPPKLNDSYSSQTKYDAGGLGTLYNVSKIFLKGVQKKDFLPPGVQLVKNGTFSLKDLPVGELASHHAGVIAVLTLGLLVAVLMPVLGLCCACRCCCKGSTEVQGRSLALAALLAIISIVILLGMALAFVTNEYMESGITKLPNKTQLVLNDADLFLKNANTEVDTILIRNYGQLSGILIELIDKCSEDTSDQISSTANALPLDSLTNMAKGLNTIHGDLQEVVAKQTEFKKASEDTVTAIRMLKTNLATVQSACAGVGGDCAAKVKIIQDEIEKVPPALPELPSIDKNTLNEYIDPEFEKQLTEGKKKVSEIETRIQQTVKDLVPTIKNAISTTGNTVMERSREIEDVIKNGGVQIQELKKTLHKADSYIEDYGGYRYYASLAISLLLLIIAVLLTIGLLCGVCSKRPTYKSLVVPAILMFVTCSVLMCIVTLIFGVSLVVESGICDPLRDPEKNRQFFSDLDQLYNVNNIMLRQQGHSRSLPLASEIHQTNITSVILSCHKNKPLYEVFDFDSRINIDEVLSLVENFSFDEYLKKVEDAVGNLGKVVIIPPAIKTKLEALQVSSIAKLDFAQYQEKFANVFQDIDTIKPKEWKNQLREISTQTGVPVDAELVILSTLDSHALSLRGYTISLNRSIVNLESHAKLNHGSFSDAVKDLLNQLTEAQHTIQSTAPAFLKIAKDSAKKFKDEVLLYLHYIVDHIKTKAFKCGPISLMYNATLTATCDEILNPLHGFWASLGWSIILFIPAAVISAILFSRQPVSRSIRHGGIHLPQKL